MENKLYPYECQIDKRTRMKMTATIMKKCRLENGYSQREVAQFLQIKQQTYNCYENGINEPNIEVLVRLSFLYQISIDDLVQKSVFSYGKEMMLKQLSDAQNDIKELKEELSKRDDTEENEEIKKAIEQMANLTLILTKELEKNKKD